MSERNADQSTAAPLTIEFHGQRYTVAGKVGLMPLMRFAHTARAGTDTKDMDGLAAMYDLLRQCISTDQLGRDADGEPTGPTEWERFEQAAYDARSDGEELMGVVAEVLKLLTDRPTGRPSDSSAGPVTVGPTSTDDSYSQVIRREEQAGRPDRALMVQMAKESQPA